MGLEIIKRVVSPNGDKSHPYYLCKCGLCGKEKVFRSDAIKKNQSCGCLKVKFNVRKMNIAHSKLWEFLETGEILNQRQLAEKLGVSQRIFQYWKVEKGIEWIEKNKNVKKVVDNICF